MPSALVAGVDCSTQATKVVVVEADTGRVVAQGRSGHEVTGSGGARETDPDVWWSAFQDALAQTGKADQVRAVSVGGQQHGLVALDGDGRPVRPAVLWNDTRSAPDAAALIEDLGGADAWAERIGSVPVASLTVTSWAWLRRTDPEVADLVMAIRLPHDELTARLVGRSVTDRGDASGTGWWSTASEDYAEDVLALERVQLEAAMLPDVLGPDEAAGTVLPEVADRLGLSSDVRVGPGTGDNMAAGLGLGLSQGQAAMSLGTSGTVYATTSRRTADPSGIVAGFADATGAFLPLAATLNATLAVDRMAAWLGIDREAVEPAGEVVVLPFLDGERTPDLPHAAGSVVGLRHATSREQILQATYDGVVVSLLEALERIEGLAGGLADAPLLLIGGGARGTVWRETVRRLSGRPLAIPSVDEAVARGAAAQAAAVLTGAHPSEVVRSWNEGSAAPQAETIEAVDRDEETLERHRRVRAQLEALNRSS